MASYSCEESSCMSITAHNEYTRDRGFAGQGYAHLTKGMVIEPHRTTTLQLILPAGQTLGDSIPEWVAHFAPNNIITNDLEIVRHVAYALSHGHVDRRTHAHTHMSPLHVHASTHLHTFTYVLKTIHTQSHKQTTDGAGYATVPRHGLSSGGGTKGGQGQQEAAESQV